MRGGIPEPFIGGGPKGLTKKIHAFGRRMKTVSGLF
jgi:hypothetical protein